MSTTTLGEAEVAVIGGGLVGVAVACGLVRSGCKTILLDEEDGALRASRGNFGLVWVQGKGDKLPPYTAWAMKAAREWPRLSDWLRQATGIDVGLEQTGGLFLCMTEQDLEQRSRQLADVRRQCRLDHYEYEILDNARLREMVPEAGPKVAGASYSPYDGHANPIRLLRALHRAFGMLGGRYEPGANVSAIAPEGGGYMLETPKGTVWAKRIVLASGLGNVDLGRHLGVEVPVRPMRGQIMVTERLPKLFHMAMEQVRQTDDGTLLLGTSWEDVGFDVTTTYDVTTRIARNAIDFFPILKSVSVVRSWAALRILSPDASPIYHEVAPGAFLLTCHSGVSLAANHVFYLSQWIADGAIPAEGQPFSLRRFLEPSDAGLQASRVA
jgi:glycine/D-amino acid oxidase-like deaminating enzyme